MKQHLYTLTTQWTGNRGAGTSGYTTYDRSHTISISEKADILCSSDPGFRGDKTKHNPEEMLVASLSSCHMLWYLHLCADAGIFVTDYQDNPVGIMEEYGNGGGHFIEVTLRPMVTITDKSKKDAALELHHKANELCFIANSVNFPVHHDAEIVITGK